MHDYAGHPFQVQLSRELAGRGHQVTHGWFSEDQGPKGKLFKSPGDPEGLTFKAFGTGLSYSKTNFLRRRAGDIAYGRSCASWIEQNKPDVVISGNTPTEAQEFIQKSARASGTHFVYWCQDFFSLAATKLLSKRFPIIGGSVGAYYRFLEKHQMRSADYIVHITDGFLAQTDRWGISRDKVTVIPNWGALDEIPLLGRETNWAKKHGLRRQSRIIYSGTLALKHNPKMLEALAAAEPERADVLVVGFGTGADSLRGYDHLSNLKVLPVQPMDEFPEVLASADVLAAVIEAEAGEYSVPSKVLSYLCAGRPIVLAASHENLAAQIITKSGAGIVVSPNNTTEFVRAAQHFLDNKNAASSAGLAGRRYAENHFTISKIADRFELIFVDIGK